MNLKKSVAVLTASGVAAAGLWVAVDRLTLDTGGSFDAAASPGVGAVEVADDSDVLFSEPNVIIEENGDLSPTLDQEEQRQTGTVPSAIESDESTTTSQSTAEEVAPGEAVALDDDEPFDEQASDETPEVALPDGAWQTEQVVPVERTSFDVGPPVVIDDDRTFGLKPGVFDGSDRSVDQQVSFVSRGGLFSR